VNLAPIVEAIARARDRVSPERAVLGAISGIDASGKGYVTARLADSLAEVGFRVASIGIDGWLNLPAVRFSERNPAEHFYRHAFRFDQMFLELVFPLRADRSVRLEADYTEETATSYRRYLYDLREIDIILLEGIFLLQPRFRPHYDLSIWIDCGFETALERAVARAQEGLPPEETRNAFRTIYFPAQEIHFERDRPRENADRILVNDPRVAALRRSFDPEDLHAVTQDRVHSVSES
jgi:uridine kinase